ncbi:MAG TPA: DUF4233 domain-containing protein [Microbacterium sp.]|uniref:DUF4233 domain-containing protein n=1 Tax=Microbacterium sp. TaxID=51671 RepID=UPI002CD8F143|nr:DUF4233 domain-containing protein [Microbacterium sp.]HWI32308.1 DUF4233 domain-containing protein [Microbacterium sp.]
MSADAAPRPRRRRTLVENLGAIVLGFESVVVFLGGLVVYGLNALPGSIPSWWGVVAGSAMAVAMIVTAGLLRHRWAIVLGWVLQLLVALAAVLVPAFLLVALIFGSMWGYATIGGARIDARGATAPEPRPAEPRPAEPRPADPQTPRESD